MKRRPPRPEPAPTADDVLERLNEVADAPPPDDTDISMPIPLPEIVEADPSQMLPAPSPDDLAAVPDDDEPASELPPPVAVAAPSAVSADVATEAVPSAPAAPNLLMPDAAPLLVPDRTETVPVITPAPAPTEAMPAAVIGEDVDGSFGLVLPQRPLQRPIAFQRGKPRVRRVTRVVRHIDPWSVFKVALVFNTILFLTCLTSGVLLWNVANATGTVDNVENFFEQFGWASFEFHGGELYHNAWIAGLFIAIGLTGFAVLLATLFNLITDLVGGVRVSVLEEEVVARSTSSSIKSRLARLTELDEAG
ncbi:MAG: DUF3566 domain-containing protein [Actinobacteria bacterium]|nr:DUF3566 domain-containing protein [Actinomycetota bacterium]